MSDRGVSYPETANPAVPCAADPEAWDLDIVGRDPHAVQAAVDTCRTCPALAACAALAAARRPVGMIQAGVVWNTNGNPRAQSGRCGTAARYKSGCRCADCCAANTEYMRGYMRDYRRRGEAS